MKNGFWLKAEEDNIPINEMGEYLEKYVNYPYDFLHGDCQIFALYLAENYGYKVECVYQKEHEEDNGHLVHAYCVGEIDGEIYYIDVRGINSDYDEFMAEFYDNGLWSNDDYSYTLYDMPTIPGFVPGKIEFDNDFDKGAFTEAMRICDTYDYFNIDKYKEEEIELSEI